MKLFSAFAAGMACAVATPSLAVESGSREAPIAVSGRDYTAVGPPRAVYPERALLRELEGAASIVCQVAERGRLTHCTIESETPEGYGFGKATIELARSFRMNATTVNGVALEGKWICLRKSFRLTG